MSLLKPSAFNFISYNLFINILISKWIKNTKLFVDSNVYKHKKETMKKQILSFIIGTIVLAFLFDTLQAQTVTLTFTGEDANNNWVRLDRVVVSNLTQGWQETIVYPDTTLTMQNSTGIDDMETMYTSSLHLSQNNPNPFTGTTDVNLTVADAGAVTLEIVDGNGRIAVETTHALSLPYGTHQFRISLSAAGTYVMTARQNGKTSSIKMVCNGAGNGNWIEYVGSATVETRCTSSLPTSATTKSHIRSITTNPFTFGDMMEYVGYATINSTEYESQHITQAQNASETIVLTFDVAPNIDGQPCPGTPTLTDIDGNTYNTVQIGQQCWMKKNLRTKKYADGTAIAQGSSTSSTTGYWYYPNNSSSNMSTYGLLYNWKAVMHGAASSETNPSNVQGICPNGWHVPSDAEWIQLTEYVSSQSQYVCGNYHTYIAKALAATTGWCSYDGTCAIGNTPANNNATGFSVLPAGSYSGSYGGFGYSPGFWSATENYSSFAYGRTFSCGSASVTRGNLDKESGFSVRCVRD